MLLKVDLSAVRGAPLRWLSCYPDEEELVLPPLSFLHPTGRWQSVSVTLEDEPAPQRDAAAGRRNRKAETREVRFTVIEVKPTFEGSGERG